MSSIDYFIIRTLGYPQQGWIDLKTMEMSRGDFLYKLTTSKAALKTVTLIPGETNYFFFRDLAQKFNLSVEELEASYDKYAPFAEGAILADSYKIPYGMSEDYLMYYLINHSRKKYSQFSNKIFGYYKEENWYKYLTVASIIQKEAANKKEMPMVASVVYNRIKKGMKLQMDGTLNYGKYSHTRVTAKRIRQDNSIYNTYKISGLPALPVASVSLDAIKAAIFPANSDYLYFVKDNSTGLHIFAKTYKEHLRNIRANRSKPKRKVVKRVKPKKQITKTTPKVIKKTEEEKKPKSLKSLWNNI